MKAGSHHTPEHRARISAAVRAAMAKPEVRTRVSERTRAAMASPIVRERIRRGMSGADGSAAELGCLLAAWNAAREAVRGKFIGKVLARVPEHPDSFTGSERAALLSPVGTRTDLAPGAKSAAETPSRERVLDGAETEPSIERDAAHG